MAFVKKTWKDRIVQYANRRLLTKSGGEVEQVTVTRDEGTISEAGDQFNASNMNNLEQRIEDGLTGLTASDIEYSSGVTVKQAIDSKIQVATFDFNKTVAATTQTTYGITRSDFNLPNNAVVVSVFLRENIANLVNAGGLVYSAYVNPTATNAVVGAIYNGTGISRTYSITATLFYTTT